MMPVYLTHLPHRRPCRSHRFSQYGLAKGCLIVVICGLTITAVMGIVLSLNIKDWAAEGAGVALKMVIRDSGLPEHEKENIAQIVRQLTEEFKQDRLSLEELERIGQIFTDRGPVYSLAAAYQFEADYLDPSGLGDNEKKHARLVINRLLQGLLSGIIGPATVAELSANLKIIDEDGDETMKAPEQVTDEEIRNLIQRIEHTVNAVGVPPGYKKIDLASELRKTIENAIGRRITADPA